MPGEDFVDQPVEMMIPQGETSGRVSFQLCETKTSRKPKPECHGIPGLVTALQPVEVRGHEVKRRTESARTACLMLAAVTPVFWFAACSGGGGSSTPEQANPALVAQAPEITITPPANRTSQSQQYIPTQTQLAVQERQIETITTPVQEPPTVPVQQLENTITDLLIRKQDVQDRSSPCA